MTSQSRSVAWVKALCLATGAMAVALVALHFSAKTSAAETGVVQSFDTISARQVKLVDAEGHPRFILAAPLPNPVVQGKEYPRSTPAYGFQFLDPAGNEMGGLAVLDSIGGGAFCFDYGTAEALCITKTKDSAYVTLLDPPPAGAQVGQPGAQRIQIYQEQGAARIKLVDGKGNDRIVLSVEADGRAEIQILDAKGRRVFHEPRSVH